MSSQCFEKISTNCDVLIHIYKMLDFEDQLRLSNVSATLKNVFERFIWKEDYQSLTIYGTGSHYVVTTETGLNRKCLSPHGFVEFLQHYAERVRKLDINKISLPDIKQFKNIIRLSYTFKGDFHDEELQLVVENLPHLQSLQLNGSFGKSHEDEHFATIGQSLLKLKKLKQLSLYGTASSATIKYPLFRRIVNELKLEDLKLNFCIEPSAMVIEDSGNDFSKSQQLKELYINTPFECEKWSGNFSGFLVNFEHLLVLSIRIVQNEVTDEVLQIIADTCKNLENLTIRHTTFASLKSFLLPTTVTELSLYACRNLKRAHLRQLLTQYRIKTFVSRLTFYDGSFEDFPISANIEKLIVDDVNMCHFKSAYDGNRHLKELTWHRAIGNLNYRRLVTGVPLETCLNLEILDMAESLIIEDTLLQLKHLRKLTMRFSRLPIQWRFIQTLLKHSPLREFLIDIYEKTSFRELVEAPPLEGFSTNVTQLKVHFVVFQLAVDFWLDLLKGNPCMTLKILNFNLNIVKLLPTIMNHEKFPRDLKTIDIFGFIVDCRDLRADFTNTVKNLVPCNGVNTNMNRLIFCRNLYK